MKFYFCETCGKRLTEKDLEAGQGKDKKLKGIYCSQCAQGVMTLETLPIDESKAREILAQDRAGRKPEERRPTSGRLQAVRRSTPPDASKPPRNGPPIVYLWCGMGAGIAVVALLLALKFASGPAAPQPSESGEVRASRPAQAATAVAGKTSNAGADARPSPVAAPEEPLPAATMELQAHEAQAQAAYEDLRKKLAALGADEGEKAAETERFFDRFGDSIVASRARSELEKARNQASGDTPKTAAQTAPQADTPPALAGSASAPLLLKVTFDEDRIDALAYGSVDANPPAGAQGKALKLNAPDGSVRGGLAWWALARNVPKAAQVAKDALFSASPGARMRFRYYCTNTHHFEVYCRASDTEQIFKKIVENVKNGQWAVADFALAEMLDGKDLKPMTPGRNLKTLLVTAASRGAASAFMDDLEIYLPGGAPEPSQPPASDPPRPDPEPPAAPVPDPHAALNSAFAQAVLEGRKSDVSAKIAECERAPATVSSRSALAQCRAMLGWLQDLEAALPAGVERLKEEDAFELRLTAGAPIQVGRKSQYQIRKVEGGVITLSGAGASIPLPVEKLHPETRAELTARGLGPDIRGRILHCFHELRTAYEQKKPSALDESAVRALAQSGAAEDDLAALRFLALQTGGLLKERAAESAFAAMEKLAVARDFARLTKALAEFHALYDSTAFAKQKSKDLEALSGACLLKLACVADAYVHQYTPGENFGDKKEMQVKFDSTRARYAYLRFDLTQLPGTFESATLRLFATSLRVKPMTMQIEAVADLTWNEAGITYANKPDAKAKLADFSPAEGKETLIDLSSAVKAAQKDGGFCLRIGIPKTLSSNAIANFASREADDPDHRPTLLIKFAP